MQLHDSRKSSKKDQDNRHKDDSLNQTKGRSAQNQERQESVSGVVDVILAVAAERKSIQTRMRQALERRDDVLVLKLARELCGVSDEESNPTRPSIN